MFAGRTRASYTQLSSQYHVLNHHNDETDAVGDSEQLADVCGSSSSSTKLIANALPKPVIYTVYGYQISKFRTYLYHAVSILFVGIPYLISQASQTFNVWLKFKKCDLKHCNLVVVTNNKGQMTIRPVHNIPVDGDVMQNFTEIWREVSNENASTRDLHIFEFENVRYIYSNRIEQFVRLRQFDEICTTSELVRTQSTGVTCKARCFLTNLYGRNSIEVAVKSYWELFRTEILNPFYLFQIFSITLWSCDDYYYYAICVFSLSAISIGCSLYETRAQSITLHNMIESSKSAQVGVLNESNEIEVISAESLVPGDTIEISNGGGIMACDVILLSGTCIVNESMLTGESVPVTKTPPTSSDVTFDWMAQKRHILYAGTMVLQARGNGPVLARVVRTGFNTSKGELVKSILFPRPIEFRFYEDSVRFVSCLFCTAAIGMIYAVRLYRERNADIQTIVVRSLDLITIVVPPALPLAMSAGQIYSQARLKTKNIFCISPQRINVCGKLKLVCFDKTGTLTDDGLTMHGCRESKNGEFSSENSRQPRSLDVKSKIVQNMATCHSLTTINGTLNGDPLDIEMFRSLNWEYLDSGEEHTPCDNLATVRPIRLTPTASSTLGDDELAKASYSIGILKQLQFSSEAQCMSVIVRVHGENHMKVFTKGAPEKIHSLCKGKTIPSNFYEILHRYTSKGYRVIAFAHKKLPSKLQWKVAERMERTDIETELSFDGFLILLNCLKPQTATVIEELHAAELRTVMITGDNIMTALSVAKDCKMIEPNEKIFVIKCDGILMNDKPELKIELSQCATGVIDDRHEVNEDASSNSRSTLLNMPADRYHFALDGTTWKAIQMYYPQLIPYVVARGTIFARFRPEQKSQIVVALKQYDYIVAMCGDGANDCGALKAAHVGVSLSKAEASVAAPFTSSEENIECIKHLALEGRCALVTSFGLFKYMIMYSFIQFIGILILYTHSSIMGNFQFLYVDLIITAGLAFSMSRQGPSNKLVPRRPSSSLLSIANVVSLLLQILLCAIVQVAAVIYLFHQPWYAGFSDAPTNDSDDERVLCWENTVVFLVSCYQYLILGVVLSKGRPYRQPIYTNGLLVMFVALLTAFTTFLTLCPLSFLADIFEIETYSRELFIFRLTILAFPLVHLMLSYGIELLIAERLWYKRFIQFVVRKKVPRNKFKAIEMNLKAGTLTELQRLLELNSL